jgi:hypothetical protein
MNQETLTHLMEWTAVEDHPQALLMCQHTPHHTAPPVVRAEDEGEYPTLRRATPLLRHGGDRWEREIEMEGKREQSTK